MISAFTCGRIFLYAGEKAPAGTYFCDGSLVPIAGNESLFQLLGHTYGGTGTVRFGLPTLPDKASKPPSYAPNLKAVVRYIICSSGMEMAQGAVGQLGQISLFVGDQPSCAGWLPCDGRTLPTIEYQVLYQLTLPEGIVDNPADVPETFQLPELSDTPAPGMQYLIKVTGQNEHQHLEPWDPDKDTGERDGQTDWPPLQTMGIIDRYVQPQSTSNQWRPSDLSEGWIIPAGQLESVAYFPEMFKFYGSRFGSDEYTTFTNFALPNLPVEDGGIPFMLLPES